MWDFQIVFDYGICNDSSLPQFYTQFHVWIVPLFSYLASDKIRKGVCSEHQEAIWSFLLLKDGIKYIYSFPDSGQFLEALEETLVMAAVCPPRQSIPTFMFLPLGLSLTEYLTVWVSQHPLLPGVPLSFWVAGKQFPCLTLSSHKWFCEESGSFPLILIYIHASQIDCLSCASSCAWLFFCLSSPIFPSRCVAVIVSLYALEPFSFEEGALGSCEKLLTSFCCFSQLLENSMY